MTLDETLFSPTNLPGHYRDHVAKDYKTYFSDLGGDLFDPEMTPEDYDREANELSQQPVTTSKLGSRDRYIGFMGKDDRIYKYDKKTGQFVVYKAISPTNQGTITFFSTGGPYNGHSNYKRAVYNYYVRELEPLDDYYNESKWWTEEDEED